MVLNVFYLFYLKSNFFTIISPRSSPFNSIPFHFIISHSLRLSLATCSTFAQISFYISFFSPTEGKSNQWQRTNKGVRASEKISIAHFYSVGKKAFHRVQCRERTLVDLHLEGFPFLAQYCLHSAVD
jgi:hypothetical protein